MGVAEDVAAIEAAALSDPAVMARLMAVGEEIADDWRRGAAMHELKTSRAKDGVVVEIVNGVPHVQTHNRFGHIDEFGSVNSKPTGAARSAANGHGKFSPTPKP
jgi:hypothetical protein